MGGGAFPTCTIIFSKFFACVNNLNNPLLKFFFQEVFFQGIKIKKRSKKIFQAVNIS
jgi:hypothetical protein